MKYLQHDEFIPIIECICHAYDYGKDSKQKAQEVADSLFPLGATIDTKVGLEALYGIIAISLELIKELECPDVTIVDENLQPQQPLENIKKVVSNQKK